MGSGKFGRRAPRESKSVLQETKEPSYSTEREGDDDDSTKKTGKVAEERRKEEVQEGSAGRRSIERKKIRQLVNRCRSGPLVVGSSCFDNLRGIVIAFFLIETTRTDDIYI